MADVSLFTNVRDAYAVAAGTHPLGIYLWKASKAVKKLLGFDPPETPRPSPFFKLRNRIYSLVLVKDGPIMPQHRPHYDQERVAMNILATCRQVRSEAVGIYYSSNDFHFGDTFCGVLSTMPCWFRSIPPDHFKQTRRFSLEGRANCFWHSPGDIYCCIIRICIHPNTGTFESLVQPKCKIGEETLASAMATARVFVSRLAAGPGPQGSAKNRGFELGYWFTCKLQKDHSKWERLWGLID
ncbi:hypothetical protein LTR36_002756 [Oleoguttula mirabilis]|uniref:Uncharacterized protein n=1 Tax=Oleoguttula mirabilis TaxID=1507867 RepID=A0AAV9JJQ2_9PEZI|nr:hypothetical protein LTR36_002756 [Oleoguttula mirabilis]